MVWAPSGPRYRVLESLPIITIMGKDSLAQIASADTAIGPPTATARRLVDASVSANTRRAYAGALGQLDGWLAGQKLDDAALAAYLAELHDAGRAASSAATAVAAARFRARLVGEPSPAGEATARVLAGYRRTTAERGRGQARPFSAADLAAVLATCHRPRRRGRGVESDHVAAARGCLDAVIAGLLFMGGLRRSEVSALRWADVEDAGGGDGDGILVTVRRSKTNQVGETSDVRYLKNGPARAVRALRAVAAPAPEGRVVPLSPKMIGLRFYGRGRGRRHRAPRDRPLRTGRFGERAHQPRRVDYRRDARRQLENLENGGPLLRRGNRRARRRGTLPVAGVDWSSLRNTLYYGDNLDVLRLYVLDESVDLFTKGRRRILCLAVTS